MLYSSMLRFGGLCSIVVGVLYILVGITHFLLPRAQLRGASGVDESFFESLSKNSLVFSLHYWLVVILSLLTFAVIIAFLALFREHLSGPLYWAIAMGFL